jgi:outer membrane protein assembly factor BamA
LAGSTSGHAPLFERFALGDTRTLRGWNKFDVNPLGGARVAHASVQYKYRWAGVFYDTGAAWDRGEDAEVRHAAGVVVAVTRSGPYLTVGFPLRNANFYPLFMLTMNF